MASSRNEQPSSGGQQASGSGARMKSFTFSKMPERHEDHEESVAIVKMSPRKGEEEEVVREVREVKNMKYWVTKISHVFRRVRQVKKRRKSSFDSLFSSFTAAAKMSGHSPICREKNERLRNGDSTDASSLAAADDQLGLNQQVAMYGTMVSHAAGAKTVKHHHHHHHHRSFVVSGGRSLHKRLWGFLRQTWTGIDCEFDELEGQGGYYKPEAIETLCQLTKFNKRELQLMYRGFKQECPSGVVKEETFKGIYAQFFPRGAEVSQYAHFVFNTFDQDHTGAITFTDFVVGLSVLARGSLQEKLRWAFSLYDINGDGYITKDEVTRIVSAIYDLMGKSIEPMIDDCTTRDHVERVFQKLDLNKDGIVTIDEFMDSCTKDENISKNMSVFNTVL